LTAAGPRGRAASGPRRAVRRARVTRAARRVRSGRREHGLAPPTLDLYLRVRVTCLSPWPTPWPCHPGPDAPTPCGPLRPCQGAALARTRADALRPVAAPLRAVVGRVGRLVHRVGAR